MREWDRLILGDGIEEPEGLHVGDDRPDDQGGLVDDGGPEEDRIAREWRAIEGEGFFADLLDDQAVVVLSLIHI